MDRRRFRGQPGAVGGRPTARASLSSARAGSKLVVILRRSRLSLRNEDVVGIRYPGHLSGAAGLFPYQADDSNSTGSAKIAEWVE